MTHNYKVDENGKPVLSGEDLKRVEEYLSSPIHQVERKPFKPIYFVFLSIGSVLVLGFGAKLLAVQAGVTTWGSFAQRIFQIFGMDG